MAPPRNFFVFLVMPDGVKARTHIRHYINTPIERVIKLSAEQFARFVVMDAQGVQHHASDPRYVVGLHPLL